MPTKIFYKEIPDPDDPATKVPVAIDSLFLPKKNLSQKVPTNKEADILDIGVDLSNLFELANTKDLPPVTQVTGEKTNIYISTSGKDFGSFPSITKVEKSAARIASVGGAYDLAANQTVNIPSQYRQRWMFYKCVVQYGQYQCITSGGLVPPNSSTYKVKSPRLLGAEYMTAILHVDLHEVTITTSEVSGYVDLAEIYTGKGEDLSNWWAPIMYMTGDKYQHNYYDDDGWGEHRQNVTGLPKGEFRYVVVGGIWYHSDFMWRQWAAGTKVKGATNVAFTISSPGYGWVFGLPLNIV